MRNTQASLPAVQEIQFHEDSIIAVKVEDQIRVALKPIVEKLGLKWNGQLQILKRDPVLSEGMHVTCIVAADGKTREMVTLPQEYLNGWLFKISVPRYKPDDPRREIIIRYQRECYKVLFQHFHPPCEPCKTLPDPKAARRLPRHDVALWNMRPWAYAEELYPELYEELEKRYNELGADKHRG